MNDLHGWITQQVDRVEETARAVEDRSAPWDGLWTADGNRAVRTVNGHVLFYRHKSGPLKPGLTGHVALNDPAAVLRRCEADRRILARHRLATEWTWAISDEAPCHGCGTQGDGDDFVTDQLNRCPELLDLAHAHGITPDILASLDTPPSVRQEPKPRGPLPDTRRVPAALRGPRWSSR